VIGNAIKQRCGITLSYENVRDTLSWLKKMETYSYGGKKDVSEHSTGKIPVVGYVAFSKRNGLLIARHFVDTRIDPRTMRMIYTKTYTHLCREITHIIRKADPCKAPYVMGISAKFERLPDTLPPLKGFHSLISPEYSFAMTKTVLETKPMPKRGESYWLLVSGVYPSDHWRTVSTEYLDTIQPIEGHMIPAYETPFYKKVFGTFKMGVREPYVNRARWLGLKQDLVVVPGELTYPYEGYVPEYHTKTKPTVVSHYFADEVSHIDVPLD
jgi:hypothetical protein